MVWISLFVFSLSLMSKEIPKFLTKHATDSIRYITSDGRYAYIKKRQGVLGLVSNYQSVDFLSESSQSDFLVKDSPNKKRLAIEVVPGTYQDFNLIKMHKILVVEWGKGQVTEIGNGRNAKLHLNDEWMSYYSPIEKIISIQNVLTQKKYQIKLSSKMSPFYLPEIEMISPDTVVYSDINEKGFSALIQYNLITQKSSILFKSSQNATRLELCQQQDYLGIGEFPYEDVQRGSRILTIKLSGSTNLAGYTTIYSSSDSDLGNLVCLPNSIYFIKTFAHDRKVNFKETEAVRLNLKDSQIKVITELKNVSQIIGMDGRILVPFRGDFFVLEGTADLTDDKLKSPSGPIEELPLEI